MPRTKKSALALAPALSKIASDAPTPPTSKLSAVFALLARDQGATIADITGATGWLPHTARAALTGLRKNGHMIARASVDGVTTYRVMEQAQ